MGTVIHLGFSPCPNDTFIFAPMVQGMIDTEGIEFDYRMEDVETLNHLAMEGVLDMVKVSFHAFLHLSPTYRLFDSGSALGSGNGPLLISMKNFSIHELEDRMVAIPGEYTTANLLLKIIAPAIHRKKILLFNEIEDAVLKDEADAGVIIHENRFTYERRGLQKIADLGEAYEKLTLSPIPLGGIIAQKKLGTEILDTLNRILHRSVAFAMENPDKVMDFVRCHAQEMEDEVMMKHIRLYVNNFTLDLGQEGRKAISILFELAHERGLIKS
ncbi:MAG: 1,4-dihydroxy-6-naphthoate synthase [Bacteroidetes bacterium]|nr:1,4-dihydroxy-6-naphthoate synthase [Bacteroidota bacterium]